MVFRVEIMSREYRDLLVSSTFFVPDRLDHNVSRQLHGGSRDVYCRPATALGEGKGVRTSASASCGSCV